MPLWRLQTVGRERLDFLYPNTGRGTTITLQPGVAFCLRKFHALISDLVRGAWARYVRQQNLELLGETADLNEFLFGSDRNSLAAVRPVLMELQHGRCFYCARPVGEAAAHVDHFIAWARYPVDLGITSFLPMAGATARKARKYHRTHKMMITSWKCRPRNSTGRFWLTESPYQTGPPRLQQIRVPRFGSPALAKLVQYFCIAAETSRSVSLYLGAVSVPNAGSGLPVRSKSTG